MTGPGHDLVTPKSQTHDLAPVGRTTWPVALKKDTTTPNYRSRATIVCVLGQILAHKNVRSSYTFRSYGCSPGTTPCLGYLIT